MVASLKLALFRLQVGCLECVAHASRGLSLSTGGLAGVCPRSKSLRWSVSLVRVCAGGHWKVGMAELGEDLWPVLHVNSGAFWIIGHGVLLASQAMACEVGN